MVVIHIIEKYYTKPSDPQKHNETKTQTKRKKVIRNSKTDFSYIVFDGKKVKKKILLKRKYTK
jgi:hypothetical protein